MCRTMLTLLPIVGLVGSNNLSTAIIILGNRSSADLCVQIQDMPDFLEWELTGVAVIAVFPGSRKLSSGTSGHMAESGESMKKVFRPYRDFMLLEAAGFLEEDLDSSLQKLGFVPEAQNDMIFSIICEELGLYRCDCFYHCIFGLLIWRLMVIATSLPGSAGNAVMRWHYEPYGHSGDPEYCCGDKYHSKYRDYASLYQLWRNLSGVSSGRDGAGFERKQKMKFYHQSEIFAYNKR